MFDNKYLHNSYINKRRAAKIFSTTRSEYNYLLAFNSVQFFGSDELAQNYVRDINITGLTRTSTNAIQADNRAHIQNEDYEFHLPVVGHLPIPGTLLTPSPERSHDPGFRFRQRPAARDT